MVERIFVIFEILAEINMGNRKEPKMANCKKYVAAEGAATMYRTRPSGDCQSCVYFSSKNCGSHENSAEGMSFT